ncbi:MAG: hypothetical protein ACOX1W_03690 [Catenisphaera adipataccumulans]|jgi:hypothetical protein|uniref:hypothetical protein n=1 Tax=Catenisphaera adipataccumulans TaxID=700500 RepID=UPI003D94C5DF
MEESNIDKEFLQRLVPMTVELFESFDSEQLMNMLSTQIIAGDNVALVLLNDLPKETLDNVSVYLGNALRCAMMNILCIEAVLKERDLLTSFYRKRPFVDYVNGKLKYFEDYRDHLANWMVANDEGKLNEAKRAKVDRRLKTKYEKQGRDITPYLNSTYMRRWNELFPEDVAGSA